MYISSEDIIIIYVVITIIYTLYKHVKNATAMQTNEQQLYETCATITFFANRCNTNDETYANITFSRYEMKKKHVKKKGREITKYQKPIEDISYKNKSTIIIESPKYWPPIRIRAKDIVDISEFKANVFFLPMMSIIHNDINENGNSASDVQRTLM